MRIAKELIPGAGFYYVPQFLSKVESNKCLDALKGEVSWEHKSIRLFGKWILQPRLTAFQGDAGISYTYSGVEHLSQNWTATVLDIKNRLEGELAAFNGALLNYYRNQVDSMGWHSDYEWELGPKPLIASVSLGEVRSFIIRSKNDKTQKLSIDLEPGSLLIMADSSQEKWEHSVPKRSANRGERVNLTFRRFIFQKAKN